MTPEGGVRVTATTGGIVNSFSLDGGEPVTSGNYTGKVKSLSFNLSINDAYNQGDFRSFILTNSSFYFKDNSYVFSDMTNFNNVFENWSTVWSEMEYPANIELVFDFVDNVWYIDSEVKGTIHTSIIEYFNLFSY